MYTSFICKIISGLIPAALCSIVFAGELATPDAMYCFDDKNGELASIIRRSDKAVTVSGVKNSYLMKSRLKDFQADGSRDQVTASKKSGNEIFFRCINPDLPDMQIEKRYFLVNNCLYREFTYINGSREKRYILPFTEMHFSKDFFDAGYYFGAGYLGPYQPAEKPSSPLKVEKYKQSSKGMVLINPVIRRGSAANIRIKINDRTVLPWWQSTIGRYREMEDRLWYLPDGWRMCGGCLDVEKNGGRIRYTDMVVFFHGDLIHFFDEIIAQNPDFSAAMREIHPINDFVMDMFCMPQWGHEPYLKYLTRLTEDGNIIFRSLLSADWADSRWRDGFKGRSFGDVTGEEARDYIRGINRISPRIAMGTYSIVIATDKYSKLYKEHPEWFRSRNRMNEEESHFPGLFTNYQTMLNKPECRAFLTDTLVDKSVFTESRYVYVDEAQQQNTINWQQDELIRDDHNIDFYLELRKKAAEKGKFLFFNGSGNPYADLNFMECNPMQLRSENWRDFAGVALGMELFSRMRQQSRIALLYWRNNFDYLTRCLSNGWVMVPDTHCSIPHMKAGYDIGKTLPVRVEYTPDFYKEPATEVESYAVRRYQSDELIISFINHDRKNGDLPVTVNLDSLSFSPETRIQVFAVELDCDNLPANKFLLSDAEHRENFQRYGWHNRAITVPKLIYSGQPHGILKHTFRNTNLKNLAQLVIVPGYMSVFSTNGAERNYFFGRTPKVKISGNTISSEAETAQILLADLEYDFVKVLLNGQETKITEWDIGGIKVQLFSIPAGVCKVELFKEPKKHISAENMSAEYLPEQKCISVKNLPNDALVTVTLNGKTVTCGRSPLAVPEKFFNGIYTVYPAGNRNSGKTLSLYNGRGSDVKYEDYPVIPSQMNFTKTDISFDGARIIAAGTFQSKYRKLRNYQTQIPCSIISADAERRTLSAGTSRRDDTLDIDQYAGFEIENARVLELKLSNTFYRAYSISGDHMHTYSHIPAKDFAGLVADYHTKNGYTHRVCFSVGIGAGQLNNPNPGWGTAKKQDIHVTLGELLNTPTTQFSLDLEKYAPADWDGKVIFSVGCNHVLANRVLTAEIISANNRHAKNFIEGFEYGSRKKVKKDRPAPLFIPRVKRIPESVKKIDSAEWKMFGKIDSLLPYPGEEALRYGTQVFVSYDSQHLYIGISAAEKGRNPSVEAAAPYNNDRVEVYLKCGDNSIFQIAVDAQGRKFTLPQKYGKDVIAHARMVPRKKFEVFMAIPWTILKYRSIVPGLCIPANFARVRLDPGMERSCWGPCRQDFGFRDTENFGSLYIGREVPGMGCFEEL